MDCKHVNDHLIDYLYQELEPDQMDQIDSHIQSCQGCSEELSTFESTRQLMRELPELEPSALVTERLMKEAARAVQPEQPGFWERVRAGLRVMVMHPAMTAAVVLVVVLGISFYAYRQTTPPTGAPEADDLPPVPPAGTTAKLEPSITSEATVERPASGDKLEAKEVKQAQLAQQPAEPDKTAPVQDKLAPKTTAPVRVARRRAARPRPKARPRARPRLRSRKGPGRYDTPALVPSAKSPSKADFGDLNRNEDDLGGLALEGEERKETGKGKAKKQRATKPKPKPKPPAATVAREHNAQHWLARAEAAMKAGKCDQALYAYNRALQLQPGLKKKVGLMVNRCIAVLARSGEARLRKAKKQYPRLAGFIEAEISRARQRRAKESNPPQQEQKKAAPPPSSIGY